MVTLADRVAPATAKTGTVLAAAVVLAGATFAYRYLSFKEFANDHFVHLSRAQQVLMGALPVRDYVDSGMPLMYGLSALAQRALGRGLHSELVFVSAAFAAAAALCCVVAARVSGSIWAGAVAAAVPTLADPVSYSYPKLLAYAAALAAAGMYVARPGAARLATLAAVVVAAFLFRHDHGVILGVGAVAALAGQCRRLREVPTTLVRFAVVAVLLLSPWLLWIHVNEGLGAYLNDGTAFSRREAEKAVWAVPTFAIDSTRPLFSKLAHGPVVNVRWVPELPYSTQLQRERDHGLTRLDPIGPRSWQYGLSDWSPLALGRLVGDPAVADTHGIDRRELRLNVPAPEGLERLLVHLYGPGEGMRLRKNAVAAVFYAVWLLPFAAVVALATGWHMLSEAARPVIIMAIVVQLLMNLTMLRDPLDTRVRDVLAPTAILLAFVAVRLWRGAAAASLRVALRTGAGAVLAFMIVAAAAVGSAHERVATTNVAGGVSGMTERLHQVRQAFAPPNQRTGRLNAGYAPLVEYLRSCTPADARLFTMTFAPELFFYTGRGFAGGQVALTPGFYVTERHATLMLERLSREDVPFVVMDSESMHEMPNNFPRVFAHVDGRYREVARFTVAKGKDLIVLADATRMRTGGFKDQQLPCFAPAAERH